MSLFNAVCSLFKDTTISRREPTISGLRPEGLLLFYVDADRRPTTRHTYGHHRIDDWAVAFCCAHGMGQMRSLCPVVFILAVAMSSNPDTRSLCTASSPTSLAFAGSVPPEDRSDNTGAESATPRLPEGNLDSDVPSLKLGETMKFDDLGPIIINMDGSTRRIGNWEQLTDKEKEVTWRRIGKRNQERRKILLEKQQKAEQEEL